MQKHLKILLLSLLFSLNSCLEFNGPPREAISCIEVARPSLTIQSNKALPNEALVKVNGEVLLDECADLGRKIASNVMAEKQNQEIVVYGNEESPQKLDVEIRDCRKNSPFYAGKREAHYKEPFKQVCEKTTESIRPAVVTVTL